MSSPRTTIVRRTVLEALKYSHGYALPEGTLRSHLDALVRPRVGDDEWSMTTDWLEINNHMVRVPSDMDEDLVQYSITERGRVLLSTL